MSVGLSTEEARGLPGEEQASSDESVLVFLRSMSLDASSIGKLLPTALLFYCGLRSFLFWALFSLLGEGEARIGESSRLFFRGERN